MADEPGPPGSDEVELSAFGPGYGECLVVHLGAGEWMIVDSCVANDGLPALDYLRRIGVDPASDVKLVVATHWHDDHVRGMSELVRACATARFSCPGALSPIDVRQAIGSLRTAGRVTAPSATSGVREMRETLMLLEPGTGRPAARWATEGRRLHTREGRPSCSVTALSPNDRVVTEAHKQIADSLDSGVHGRVPRPERNLGAVVLWVAVGDLSMLLGADLQETSDPQTGWTAVVDCPDRPSPRAEIFKVPHHGAGNAHQPRVWEEMLVDVRRPQAVICPCSNGATQLPTAGDLERICALGDVHQTAPCPSPFMVRGGRKRRRLVGDYGRVTLRRRLGSDAAWVASHKAPAADPC